MTLANASSGVSVEFEFDDGVDSSSCVCDGVGGLLLLLAVAGGRMEGSEGFVGLF